MVHFRFFPCKRGNLSVSFKNICVSSHRLIPPEKRIRYSWKIMLAWFSSALNPCPFGVLIFNYCILSNWQISVLSSIYWLMFLINLLIFKLYQFRFLVVYANFSKICFWRPIWADIVCSGAISNDCWFVNVSSQSTPLNWTELGCKSGGTVCYVCHFIHLS